MSSTSFTGFPKEAVKFYRDLVKNNDKMWFDERKPDYEEYVLGPARAFVVEMGKRLKKISPGVIADPRVNQSLFRIYRDTRFSNDKRPYKTHLGIFFWEGKAKRMECPGFYFHLEPPNLMVASGLYMFTKPQLEEFRKSMIHKSRGPALEKAVKQVEKKGHDIGGDRYKRVPRGFDPGHKRADLLLYKGMYAYIDIKIPEELHSKKLLDHCEKIWKDMAPLHKWFVALAQRT
jgi:uncharacterized protein (TIGR02453 family)